MKNPPPEKPAGKPKQERVGMSKHYYLRIKKWGVDNAKIIQVDEVAMSAADAMGLVLKKNPMHVIMSCEARGRAGSPDGGAAVIDYEVPRHEPVWESTKRKEKPPQAQMLPGMEEFTK